MQRTDTSDKIHRPSKQTLIHGRVHTTTDPADVLLQSISSELIRESNIEALYQRIVDAAMAIMRSDFASLQMLVPERGSGGELRLLAFRGFSAEAAKFWEWVRADSQSTCGLALRAGERTVAESIAACDLIAGSEDKEVHLQTGILACQTTPLVSRTGEMVGMQNRAHNRRRDPVREW